MPLGNDVVDLAEARALAKERDERFLARVFIASERECIRRARDPALALWFIWAAKESLFKAAQRIEPGKIFAHQKFILSEYELALAQAADPAGGEFRGPLSWNWNPEFIHCVAGGQWVGRVETVGEWSGKLSRQERESVHSPASRDARLLAKRLLQEKHSLINPEVVRWRESGRFLPPEIWESGKPVAGVEVSLSHDGRFVAAVISVSSPGAPRDSAQNTAPTP